MGHRSRGRRTTHPMTDDPMAAAPCKESWPHRHDGGENDGRPNGDW